MLLRATLVASVFSALVLAGELPSTSTFSGKAFPDQDKNLEQLTRQALDKRMSALITGAQQKEMPNPTRMPRREFVLPSDRVQNAPGLPFRLIAANRPRLSCSIPLLEAKAPTSAMKDQMPKVAGAKTWDRIAVPTPAPVCKDWQ